MPELQAQGCVHTETFGWERPKWFSLDGRAEDYGYRRNNVFDVVRDEVAAVHERVAVLDLTGFAKYDISGPAAEAFLNRVCANRMPRKIGGIALVHLLSPSGRIQGEMTVTRLGDDRFYALSAAAAELRDLDLLTQSVRPGRIGAHRERHRRARRARAERPACARGAGSVDRCDLWTTTQFRWLRAREILIAGQPVRALRVSYVGRAGLGIACADRGVAGCCTMRSGMRGGNSGSQITDCMRSTRMRIEKGYKAWSTELTNELNMLEADMARFIDCGQG